MKLSTLNLQGLTDWERRKPRIIEYLRSVDPDVIMFQEVVYLPDIERFNQVQIINEVLGYPYEHSAVTRLQASTQYTTYREGLAFISKYPVAKTDTIVLKQQAGDEHNRIVQFIDVFKGDALIKLANIHFSLSDFTDYATPHLMETLEILASRNETRIIGGDFNLDHLEKTSELWDQSYTSTLKIPYVTFPNESKRIDYFLAPDNYTMTSLETSGNGLSDHRALTIELEEETAQSFLRTAARAATEIDQLR